MAVIVQRLVGADHNGKFYPDFDGVGKSYNYYPIPPQKSEDGIAQVPVEETEFTQHLRFKKPISVRINGHLNKGIITKPGIS